VVVRGDRRYQVLCGGAYSGEARSCSQCETVGATVVGGVRRSAMMNSTMQ